MQPQSSSTSGSGQGLRPRTDPPPGHRQQTDSEKLLNECWICYDAERTDAGPLIQPCMCRGDVSAVHHDCLRTWLMESNSNPDHVKCKVCNEPYRIQKGDVWLPAGLTVSHGFRTAAIVTIMCSAATIAAVVVKLFDHLYVQTISVGVAILIEYICLRLLGFNLLTVYNRAKMSAIRIGGRMLVPPHQERSNPPVVNADVLKECLTQTCDDSQPKAMSPPHESSSRQHQSQQTHPLPSQPQSLDSVVVVGEVSPMSPPDKVVVVHESPPEEASKVTTP